jgi:prepilin-type N-terminal cleavage/methylation domain-containing protein
MQIRQRKKSGFTLIEMMVVVATIGLLAAIAIPNMVHARTTSQINACINNLRQIDAAKQQWALENGKSPTVRPNNAALQPYLGRGSNGALPTCPLDAQQKYDTSYNTGTLQIVPACFISPTNHLLM